MRLAVLSLMGIQSRGCEPACANSSKNEDMLESELLYFRQVPNAVSWAG